MTDTITSSNMLMPIPVVGVSAGPTYALNVDSCLTIIDGHDHSSGKGVPVTPSGLNINSDLSFGGNNITSARSLRLSPQSAVFSAAADIGCVYESGVDLYYRDGVGNNVRITQSGGVVGSPGSISGLTSPASATYVGANQTFVWQSAANTPANLDAASIILRNLSAGSKGLTLAPPNAMGADYAITLPTLPASQKIMTLDNSGNMSAPYVVDNSTIEVSSNTIQVKAQGVGPTQLTDAGVTPIKIGPNGWAGGGTTGSFSTSSGSFVGVTALSITSYGNPIKIGLAPLSVTGGAVGIGNTTASLIATFRLIRDIAGTPVTIGTTPVGSNSGSASGGVISITPASISFIDYTAPAGLHTYTLQVASGGGATITVQDCILLAFL